MLRKLFIIGTVCERIIELRTWNSGRLLNQRASASRTGSSSLWKCFEDTDHTSSHPSERSVAAAPTGFEPASSA